MAVNKYEDIPVPGTFALAQMFDVQMNLMSRYSPEERLFTLEERMRLLEEKVQKLMEERNDHC